MNNKGFTLVELMVVIVIVGILAAVAVPKFQNQSHKAKTSEFPTVLTSIYTQQEALAAETGSYTDDIATWGDDIPASSTWFSYGIVSANNTSFLAAATANLTFGNVTEGDFATIDQDGGKSASSVGLRGYQRNWTNQ